MNSIKMKNNLMINIRMINKYLSDNNKVRIKKNMILENSCPIQEIKEDVIQCWELDINFRRIKDLNLRTIIS